MLKAPATIANIVCGYDVLGMALEKPFDEIIVSYSDIPGIQIHHTDEFNLPTDPKQNVAGIALQAMMDELEKSCGFNVQIHKNIMPGSGLGSSGASAIGVVAAANKLLGNKFTKNELLRFAMEGERCAGGLAHADNVAPCLFGGITLNMQDGGIEIDQLPFPPLYVTVIHPQIEIKTSDARKIIKKEVSMNKAIVQWSHIAGLVAGFCKGDYNLIRRSLHDVILEPVRSVLIPKFDELKAVSMKAGALGGGIAGSGPSVFMFCETESIAESVENEMTKVYAPIGLGFKTYVTTIKTSPLI